MKVLRSNRRPLEPIVGDLVETRTDCIRYFTISPPDIAKVTKQGHGDVVSELEYVASREKMMVVGVSDATIVFYLKLPFRKELLKEATCRGMVFLLRNEKVLCCHQEDFYFFFRRAPKKRKPRK